MISFIWGDQGAQYRIRFYLLFRYSILYKESNLIGFHHEKTLLRYENVPVIARCQSTSPSSFYGYIILDNIIFLRYAYLAPTLHALNPKPLNPKPLYRCAAVGEAVASAKAPNNGKAPVRSQRSRTGFRVYDVGFGV